MMTTKNTIMAKNKKETTEKETGDRLVIANDMVKFTSNGKNPVLGKQDKDHVIHRIHAENLVSKGWGEITEDLEVVKPNTGLPQQGLAM